jgi:hypothetical protein
MVKGYGFIRGDRPELSNLFFHASEFRDDESQVPCPGSTTHRLHAWLKLVAQLKAHAAVEFTVSTERATGKTSAVDVALAASRARAASASAPSVAAVTGDRRRGIVERELPKGLVVRASFGGAR